MLKAEKQLTTNRLRRDSEIPNEKRGRAAWQTDPASCRNPWARGNGAALSVAPATGAWGGWERGLPRPHGEERRRRGPASTPLPAATPCPSTGGRDPPHAQPSPAFGLKPRQFV